MENQKPTKIIVDLSKPKGERETIVELSDDEIAQLEARKVEIEAEQAALQETQAKKEAQRSSALAKLAALGLTEEEIAAIIG